MRRETSDLRPKTQDSRPKTQDTSPLSKDRIFPSPFQRQDISPLSQRGVRGDFTHRSSLVTRHLSCALCFLLFLLSYPAFADDSLTHNVGKVEMLVSDWGAFTRIEEGAVYPNFIYSGRNYLDPFSEVWVGNSLGYVASAYDGTPDGVAMGEWQPTGPSGRVEYMTDSPNASQSIRTQYAPDRYNDFPISITVDQYTYAWDSNVYPDDDDYIIMKLVLTNLSGFEIEDFFMAIQTNWDVDYNEERDDLVDWDAERRAGIAYDSDGTDPTYLALALLSGELASHNIADVYTWAFLDFDRSILMSNGEIDDLKTISNVPGNYLNVISTGPYTIPDRGSVTAIYAFAAGQDLDALRENIDAAKRRVTTPGKLVAASTKEAINLNWSQGISPGIVSYKIYRSDSSGGGFSEIASVSTGAKSYSDTDVEIGTTYYYVVTAINSDGGESGYSNEVNSSPGVAPPSPRNLTIRSEASENPVLHWEPPTDEEEIAGYVVLRNSTGSDPWAAIASLDDEVRSFVDQNVYDGETYYYAVASVNSYNWNSDYSNVVSVTIHRPGPPESAKDLAAVKVAPNPCKISSNGKIKFINLTSSAKIHIYTLAGELVKVLRHNSGTGEEEWDLLNDEGAALASGLYVYYVESYEPERTGKITASGKFALVK